MDYMVRDEIKDYALRSTGPEPELQIELTEKTGKTVGKTVIYINPISSTI